MVLPLNAGTNSNDGEVVYLAGIGTSGTFASSWWEGATGTGISERILDAYSFLAERYQPGDRIFGFGFSRGAFAVRSFAGFLQHAGLPETPLKLKERELSELYNAYRKRARYETPTALPVQHRRARVDFLGVWDTVGALAFHGLASKFHNISPNNVGRVAHALSLDEQRRDFEPEFWDTSGNGTVVEEAWFAGAHTNIGGGYINEELSNIALTWVVSRAVEAGIPNRPEYIKGWYGENTYGRARLSYDEFLSWMGVLAWLAKGRPVPRKIREGQAIHKSVFDRLEETSSDYTTGPSGKPADWQAYTPAARTNDGKPMPSKRSEFNGPIVETPDYLDSYIVDEFHLSRAYK
jgi:uncharacterized protein (DUF2235 family)